MDDREHDERITILVCVKNVYGNERIYPMTYAEELETLTGQKTLSKTHIRALESLGFKFFVQPAKL